MTIAHPNNGREHPSLARLHHYEAIMELSFGNKDEPAIALLRIHEQRLYKLTHKSFPRYCKERWGFGGSRGYQLIKYAKAKLSCMDRGQTPPGNERQSRDSTGPKRQQLSYEGRLGRVLGYLQRNLAKSFAAEPQRFLQDVRQGLNQLEHQLVTKPPAQAKVPTASTPSQLVPRAQIGPVVGMSINEAKRLGYVQ